MLAPHVHARRRQELSRRLDRPVLLLGNGVRARNLPLTPLPFRQDSTFLYFTGCDLPDAAALILDGRCTLYLPAPAPDDALWHGPGPSHEALREQYGVDEVRPAGALEEALLGLEPLTLAVADEERNRLGSKLTGLPLRFGVHHGDEALVDAVIAMRRPKEPEDLDALREAARHSTAAHLAVMGATRPGAHERVLAALFEAVLAARGCALGYGTILTQRGEILHNFHYTDPLEAGRLLLVDGGGELDSGHGVDITRTFPVSGTFTPRQQAACEAVLAAQEAAIARCVPGTRFREVHDTASRVLARFLVDEGLLKGDPDDAVASGAHALFFPHGVGHHLGMDVHDLENFGDRPSYPPGRSRPDQFGTRNLRLDLPLERDWVVTVEPGFYVVPAILDDPALRDRFRDQVDFDRASAWLGFGGIRIEDDVHVTEGEPEVLTAGVPKTVDALAAVVGQGHPAEHLLA